MDGHYTPTQEDRDWEKVYEAWKQYYPSLTAKEIAIKIGKRITTTQHYISEFNATNGNLEKAKRRAIIGTNRARLRQIIKSATDPNVLSDLHSQDAKLTQAIKDLTIAKQPAQGTILFQRTSELARQEPGLSDTQIAERLGSNPLAIADARHWLKKANGDYLLAVSIRNEKHRERRAKARAKSEAEWEASGIDD